jgi:flagellin
MGFTVNNNLPAMNTSAANKFHDLNLNHSLSALSSGSQVGSAAYDVSGLAISNKLSAQASGLGQAIMNSNDSIGMLQVADGGLQGINDNMERINTLTLQASNGTLNDSDRAIIQKEIDGLMKSSNDIASNTSYNGKKLLDGSQSNFTAQTGSGSSDTSGISIEDARVASIVPNGTIDVSTQDAANSSLKDIQTAMKNIMNISSSVGAAQNQLESNIRNITVTQLNVAAADSQISDIDFAAESANFSKQNILSQVGAFAQSQANASQSHAMNLFN